MDGSLVRGTLIGQRWRVQDYLGAGGFGEVLLVTDESEVDLGRAAIKLLHPGTSPAERDDFLREVKKIASLRHQNLVGYLDSGVHLLDADGRAGSPRPFVVTELCDGSLADHLARHPGRVLDHAGIVAVLDDVIAGLRHLHHRNLIHRDIKPGNVLLAEGIWKLGDFGLMRDLTATGSYHRGGAPIGTPLFMAPELFTDASTSAASDVYAVGVMVHVCATGQPLHSGSGPALLYNIANGTPTISPDLDPRLFELVRRATAPSPDQRPDADGLSELLHAGGPGPGPGRRGPVPGPDLATRLAPVSGDPGGWTPPGYPSADHGPAPHTPGGSGPRPGQGGADPGRMSGSWANPDPHTPGGWNPPPGTGPGSGANQPGWNTPGPNTPGPDPGMWVSGAWSGPQSGAPGGSWPGAQPGFPAGGGFSGQSTPYGPGQHAGQPGGPGWAAAAAAAHGQAVAAAVSPRRRSSLLSALSSLVVALGIGVPTTTYLVMRNGDEVDTTTTQPTTDPAVPGVDSTTPTAASGPDECGVILGDGVEIQGNVGICAELPADLPTVPGEITNPGGHFAPALCSAGSGAASVVTNPTGVPVSYWIEIDHHDAAGIRVDTSYETLEALAPGASAVVSPVSIEETATTCSVTEVRATAEPALVANLADVVISGCGPSGGLAWSYDLVYDFTNTTASSIDASITFALVDADGVRIADASSEIVYDLAPGETTHEETSPAFFSLTDSGRAAAGCVVAAVEISEAL